MKFYEKFVDKFSEEKVFIRIIRKLPDFLPSVISFGKNFAIY